MGAKLVEVRRLTGPNVLLDRAGAVVDVALGGEAPTPGPSPKTAGGGEKAFVDAWESNARQLLAAVGWSRETTAARTFAGGASLAISAPIDALYAACDLNQWAFSAAVLTLAGDPAPDLAEAAEHLRAAIAAESNPRLIALQKAARAQGVALVWDTEQATVGLGAGSRTWPIGALPAVHAVDWSSVRDIPVALVTGTNGKSTTVRLAAAMIDAAGRVPGVSTTDWVKAGDDVLDRGDYSGPGGARLALRDSRVQVAVLETARGGMLRRGLAVERADVAAVTNLAEDHLGDFGVPDVAALADVKLVVARVAGRVVLNADDALLRARGVGLGKAVTWFGLGGEAPTPGPSPKTAGGGEKGTASLSMGANRDGARVLVEAHVASEGRACVVEKDRMVLYRERAAGGPEAIEVARVDEVPITFGGAARYNVANALAAIGIADGLGLPIDAIRAGLLAFANTPESNPGRLNVFDVGGVRVVVDYAHNPHGVRALNDVIRVLPAARRIVAIGQAGDRDDAAIYDLARAVMEGRPDAVIVKELRSHLRGRPEGEVPRVIAAALRELGLAEEAIMFADDDVDAARRTLAWARPGDLVVLAVHGRRGEVLGLVGEAAGV